MKRVFSFALMIISILLLLGCNRSNLNVGNEKLKTPSTEAGIIGYVIKIENERILVVSQEVKDFSSTGGVKEYYDAIWFSKTPKGINIGDKVKVWYNEVLQSYPGQSEAVHLEVVSSQNPTGANITESEALLKALTSQEIDTNMITVVKSIQYDNQTDKWDITLKDTIGDKLYTIEVEDR